MSPGGRCEKRLPDLAPAPRAGASIPLQARGHRRSMTPRAQCSSADPTEPGGWSARPFRSSPTARKHSSSAKSLKKPGHPIWGPVTKRQRKHYKSWAMLEERAGRLERKGNPATPIYSCARHQASSLSKGGGLDRPRRRGNPQAKDDLGHRAETRLNKIKRSRAPGR